MSSTEAKNPVPVTWDEETILRDADRCVMCGMCSTHCPTYTLAREEAESPRGRVSLIQALLRDQLPADGELERHLDNCLGCRTCERVCPSGVPFGRLIDAARATLEARRPRPRKRAVFEALTSRKFLLRGGGRLLRAYQRSGARRLARASGMIGAFGLRRLEGLLPEVPDQRPLRPYYPAIGEALEDVALFRGCIASVFDLDTLRAAVTLLNHVGYGVRVPRDQGCCGALHLHDGDPQTAAAMAAHNIKAFAGQGRVVSTASGCGAVLSEYGGRAGPDGHEDVAARDFAARHIDIGAFLAEAPGFARLRFRPLEKRVALHTPCSMRNVLRGEKHPETLLRAIPGLRVSTLPDSPRCCGAAGSYMLTHGDTADALRDRLLEGISQADYLVTTNIGCGLHLQAGLRRRGLDIQVVHPLVLLSQQLIEG